MASVRSNTIGIGNGELCESCRMNAAIAVTTSEERRFCLKCLSEEVEEVHGPLDEVLK